MAARAQQGCRALAAARPAGLQRHPEGRSASRQRAPAPLIAPASMGPQPAAAARRAAARRVAAAAAPAQAAGAAVDPGTLKAYLRVQNGSDVRGVALDSNPAEPITLTPRSLLPAACRRSAGAVAAVQGGRLLVCWRGWCRACVGACLQGPAGLFRPCPPCCPICLPLQHDVLHWQRVCRWSTACIPIWGARLQQQQRPAASLPQPAAWRAPMPAPAPPLQSGWRPRRSGRSPRCACPSAATRASPRHSWQPAWRRAWRPRAPAWRASACAPPQPCS